jgi:hypothetical protein
MVVFCGRVRELMLSLHGIVMNLATEQANGKNQLVAALGLPIVRGSCRFHVHSNAVARTAGFACVPRAFHATVSDISRGSLEGIPAVWEQDELHNLQQAE